MDLTTGSNSLFQRPDVRFVGLNVVAADAHKLGATADRRRRARWASTRLSTR